MRFPSITDAAACFGQMGSAPKGRNHRVRRERQNPPRPMLAAVRALMRLRQGVRRAEHDRATASEGVSSFTLTVHFMTDRLICNPRFAFLAQAIDDTAQHAPGTRSGIEALRGRP